MTKYPPGVGITVPVTPEFAEILTEMLVSQDMIRLVGFATQSEREWFKLLQTVQGVGTKVALAGTPYDPDFAGPLLIGNSIDHVIRRNAMLLQPPYLAD